MMRSALDSIIAGKLRLFCIKTVLFWSMRGHRLFRHVIWASVVSDQLGGAYTTSEKFENAPSTLIRHENAALFLRLGLPSTLIRHENAALYFYG